MPDYEDTSKRFAELAAAEGEPVHEVAGEIAHLSWIHQHFTLHSALDGRLHLHCNVGNRHPGDAACFQFDSGISLDELARFATEHFITHVDMDRIPAGPILGEVVEQYLLPHNFAEEGD